MQNLHLEYTRRPTDRQMNRLRAITSWLRPPRHTLGIMQEIEVFKKKNVLVSLHNTIWSIHSTNIYCVKFKVLYCEYLKVTDLKTTIKVATDFLECMLKIICCIMYNSGY